MVERTPAILGVNLKIYRVNENNGRYNVTESLYTPYDGPAVPTTISILLSGGHYGLIYRIGDINLSNFIPKNESDENDDEENEDEENENENALMKQLEKNSKALEEERIRKRKEENNFIKMTLNASHKKLSGYHNLSPQHNIQKLVQQSLLANQNQLPPRLSTRRKPRIVRGNEQTSESLVKNAENKAKKLEELQAKLAAATAAKKAVYQKYSLTNSSNNNSNNNSLKELYPYGDTRKSFLEEALIEMKVPFKSKNTKPVLYRAFIKATRKRQQQNQ